MPVPTTVSELSTTASSNGPDGATEAGSVLDDYLRAVQALFKGAVSAGSDIASAGTITPPVAGESFNLTGTTTVTAIASTNSYDGRIVWFRHTGAHAFTNSATLVCLGGASITFASGDISAWRQRTSGTWDQVLMQRADGALLGDSWNVDTSGRLLNNGNTQPFVHAVSSAQRTSNGTCDTYTQVTEYGGDNFNPTTGIYTVPVSGIYEVIAMVDADAGGSGGTVTAYINVNSVESTDNRAIYSSSLNDFTTITLAHIRAYSATNTIAISGTVTGSGTAFTVRSLCIRQVG